MVILALFVQVDKCNGAKFNTYL